MSGKKTVLASRSHAHQLLEKATTVLALSDEDLIYKGIAAGVSERMSTLTKAATRLQEKYGALEALERKIQTEEISPDDHRLYTDLLEWRAIQHEQAELLQLFAAL